MVLHDQGESDPNKKTMDFEANTSNNLNNVLFFETELKDGSGPAAKKKPELSSGLLDVDIGTNNQGALSPLQNSKLSRMINDSIVTSTAVNG